MIDYTKRRTMMVDTQVRPSDVTKFPIIDAMLSVPREVFVPSDMVEAAYVGENMDLGDGRVMLEARTFAKMLDALDIGNDDAVLDLGCGLGYSTAVIARMAQFVVAVEQTDANAGESQNILSAQSVDNAAVLAGPLAEGAARHGPFDAILVHGAVADVPEALTAQLKDGGRIACLFMEGALGVVRIGHRIDGAMVWRFAFNASAPMLDGFQKRAEFAL
jgi:protein-L-isoaspartate(D-aspartate) O-methyltransferase